MEDHVAYAYQAMQPHFPDFCACEVCRDDALVFTLNRVPPRYVASRTGSVKHRRGCGVRRGTENAASAGSS